VAPVVTRMVLVGVSVISAAAVVVSWVEGWMDGWMGKLGGWVELD
jgi:hypothetical protein